MNALLVRMGAERSAAGGSWNGPVDGRTGEFVYVPIPEGRETHPGLEKPYALLAPELARFGVELPLHLRDQRMHLDPDFEHLTYGDRGERAKQLRANLSTGDLIVFYAGLADVAAPSTGATITDAILQAGLNYEHVAWPRVECVRHTVPGTTTSGFIEVCEQRGAAAVIGWSHQTKLTRIAALAAFLAEQGIETEADLRGWLCDVDAHTRGERRAQLLALPGIGPKTVDYLAILSGDTAAVAPDVHQLRFLALAGIEVGSSPGTNHERITYERARDIVIQTAAILGVAPSALDHAIWAYMSGSNATW